MKHTTPPLVSVIVTTYNNHDTLEACLDSIQKQDYKNIELVVVDNYSGDDTAEIAKRYTPHVFIHGPERCAQRNFAVSKVAGEFVVIIDSDMELSPGVVASCVEAMEPEPDAAGVIIPEESFGRGFWAQCKKLERSFYIGVDWVEAARFFPKKIFEQVGGYDEHMVSGEDWDLSQRAAGQGKLLRIPDLIYHNEGAIKLFKTLKKKSYYAQKFSSYTNKSAEDSPAQNRAAQAPDVAAAVQPQAETSAADLPSHNPYVIVLKRFGLYLSHPVKLFRRPHLGLGVLFMKACEFGFGAFGYLASKGTKDDD